MAISALMITRLYLICCFCVFDARMWTNVKVVIYYICRKMIEECMTM